MVVLKIRHRKLRGPSGKRTVSDAAMIVRMLTSRVTVSSLDRGGPKIDIAALSGTAALAACIACGSGGFPKCLMWLTVEYVVTFVVGKVGLIDDQVASA